MRNEIIVSFMELLLNSYELSCTQYLVILIWSNTLFSSCLYNQALDMFIRYTPVMSLPTTLMVWYMNSGLMIVVSLEEIASDIYLRNSTESSVVEVLLQTHQLLLNWQPPDYLIKIFSNTKLGSLDTVME